MRDRESSGAEARVDLPALSTSTTGAFAGQNAPQNASTARSVDASGPSPADRACFHRCGAHPADSPRLHSPQGMQGQQFAPAVETALLARDRVAEFQRPGQ